jgi:hypothetical protein
VKALPGEAGGSRQTGKAGTYDNNFFQNGNKVEQVDGQKATVIVLWLYKPRA